MLEHPVVFLDKDGTLVKDVPYNTDPRKVVLEEGAARGLRLLADAGYHFIVVTNQSGVARGYFPEEALQGVSEHLSELVMAEAGAAIDGFYYCPHHPEGVVTRYAVECGCRKPAPGMFYAAAADLGIPLARSWMIGDILNDIEAGNRAGCRTILIDNGGETAWKPGPFRTPDFTAPDLEEAALLILFADGRELKTNGKSSGEVTGGNHFGGEPFAE